MYFQRLEDLRIDHDKTQQEIADLLFCQREVYRRYEKGTREIPVWAVIRFYCSRRYGANWMRTAATFLTILVVWGAFQLGCVAAVLIWRGGGFSPLHRHLQREAEPEKVIVVEREAVSAAERTPEPVQKNP